LAGRRSEDLSLVPADVLVDRWRYPPLGLVQRLADEAGDEALGHLAATHELGRDNHPPVVRDPDRAEVEQLGVQRAQAHRVLELVGPVERVPSHVGGVKGDRGGTETTVVAAHRTAVLVCHQHPGPETRVPPSPDLLPEAQLSGLALQHIEIEAHHGADVRVQRLGEVGVEQRPGDERRQPRVERQRVGEPGVEFA
jgi:hypothetical protein